MKTNRLLHAIGQVDSEFIENSAPEIKHIHQNKFKKILAAAACFAVVASVGIGLWQGGNFGGKEIATLNSGNEICFYKSGSTFSQLSADIDINAAVRELKKSEAKLLFDDLPVTGLARFDKSTHELIEIEGKTGSIKLIVSSPEIPLKDTVIEGSEQNSTVNNISVRGGYFITKENSRGERTAIYYADFKVGDKTIYVENAGNESEKEQVKDELASIILKLTEIDSLDFDLISE